MKYHLAKCLCGGIKLIIGGKFRNVSNCHRFQCMKTHGNFGPYTACEDNKLTFLSKKTLKWFKSSNIATRGFCNVCGSSIFFKQNNSYVISISAGVFSKCTKLKTTHHIFIKGKMDFYRLDNKLPKFNKSRK